MEVLIGLGIIIGLLVGLDVAALKWGKNMRQSGWLDGSYDPYYDWHSRESAFNAATTSNTSGTTPYDFPGKVIMLAENTGVTLN